MGGLFVSLSTLSKLLIFFRWVANVNLDPYENKSLVFQVCQNNQDVILMKSN